MFCYPINNQQVFYFWIFISVASVLSADQEVSLCQRNFGLLKHLEEDAFLFSINPREASSAGFILDGIYIH